MTGEELRIWHEKTLRHQTLLTRLEAGDDLHREAASEIRRIQGMYKEDMRDASRDARAAYQEGRWDERSESER